MANLHKSRSPISCHIAKRSHYRCNMITFSVDYLPSQPLFKLVSSSVSPHTALKEETTSIKFDSVKSLFLTLFIHLNQIDLLPSRDTIITVCVFYLLYECSNIKEKKKRKSHWGVPERHSLTSIGPRCSCHPKCVAHPLTTNEEERTHMGDGAWRGQVILAVSF